MPQLLSNLKYFFLLLTFGVLVSTCASDVYAAEFRSGDSVSIAEDEIIETSTFLSGERIDVSGTILGDLWCVGQTVHISGTVDGDVHCAGQTIALDGYVSGDARLAGQSLTITGTVEKNTMLLGQTSKLDGAQLFGESYIFSQEVFQKGFLGDDLFVAAEDVDLQGQIQGNVTLHVDELTIGREATISGAMSYYSDQMAHVASMAAIGEIKRVSPQAPDSTPSKEKRKSIDASQHRLASFLINLGFGILIALLFSRAASSIIEKGVATVSRSVGVGLVFLLGMPVIAVVLALTIIGIPLTLLLVIFYALFLFASRIFAGAAVGRWLTSQFFKEQTTSPVVWMIAGIPVLWLMFWLPVIGSLVSLISVLWGVGAIAMVLWEKRHRSRAPKIKHHS